MKALNNSVGTINKKLIKALFFGVVVGSLIITILLIISSIIILQTGILPADILEYIILAFIGVGSLIGGFTAGRIYHMNGIIIGSVTGFIMFLILFLSGISEIKDGLSIMTLLKLVVTIVPGILGGILGVNKKEKIKFK